MPGEMMLAVCSIESRTSGGGPVLIVASHYRTEKHSRFKLSFTTQALCLDSNSTNIDS